MRFPRAGAIVLLLTALWACQRRGQHTPATAPVDARVSVAAIDASPPDPAAAEATAAAGKAVAVFRCFDRDMSAAAAKTPALAAYRRNVFTELFAFDHLFADGKTFEQSESALCLELGERYRKLFLTVAPASGRAGRHKGDVVAQAPVDADPAFARAAGGPTALHLLEHAEITRAVLHQVLGARPRAVTEAVVNGTVQTAVQRFGDDLAYASRTESDSPDLAKEIARSEEAFGERLSATISGFVRHARDGYFANASLDLGNACHAVQELAFSGGLTRRQQAGLRFFVGGRHASGRSEEAARREAQSYTKEIVLIARAALEPERWKTFLAWAPPLGFDAEAAVRVMAREQGPVAPLGLLSLLQYWANQLVYRHSPAARKQLEEGPEGIVRWDAKRVLDRVRQAVPPSGIALRPAQR